MGTDDTNSVYHSRMASRPAVPPVTLSSTFVFDTTVEMADAVRDKQPHLYSRWSNPTVEAAEEAIARLEHADRAVLCSSGMAAVHLALLAALGDGIGPIVALREVYGGTHELLNTVRWPAGVKVRQIGLADLMHEAEFLAPTAVLYLETPTNPLLRLVDVAAVRARATPGVRIVVDGTFGSPHLAQLLDRGADLVLHSATKYLGGHHDLVAGVVSGFDPLIGAVWRWRKILGPTLEPAAAYRLWRGLQTLALRVERQSQSAAALAAFLSTHDQVTVVHHPSLPSHPDHRALATLHRDGLGGGVLAFEVSGAVEAARIADRLQTVAVGPSLGGVHSLITWPAGVTHANVSEKDQLRAGIRPGLLRLAVGIEDLDVLRADLEQALS